MSEITRALALADTDDIETIKALVAASYDELAKLARARLWSSNQHNQFATESLLHECYLRLVNIKTLAITDRKNFFGYASKIMRSIIVDDIRQTNAQRRGAGLADLTLHTEVVEICPDAGDVEAVHDALTDLERLSPDLARLVEMRFFGGMTELEIAEVLGVSERTVRREWEKARAALIVLLEDTP